jgi:hypothetical protein
MLGWVHPVFSDSEVEPRVYVKSSKNGRYYAKSIPEGNDLAKGKTYVYRVRKSEDELLYTYDWFASQIYLLNNSLIRLGPWARGSEAIQSDLGIGFYSRGKLLKEYSMLDIVNMGYEDANNIQRSFSHYTVFEKILGYQWSGATRYYFDVKTHEGQTLSFNIETGKLRTEEDKKHDLLLDAVSFFKARCYDDYLEQLEGKKRNPILSEVAFRKCAKEKNSYIPPTPKGYQLVLGEQFDLPKLERK